MGKVALKEGFRDDRDDECTLGNQVGGPVLREGEGSSLVQRC